MRRVSLVTLALASLAGCQMMSMSVGMDGGDNDSGGTCPLYVVPTGTDLMTPVVLFKSQVMPILNANCNSALCHGTTTGPMGGLFLGDEAAKGSDASTVRGGLVGVAAGDSPSMPLVTASDPAKSFLMHKMDADQCAFAGECTFPNCGALMPNGNNTPLPVANRDTVRRWIAQGAKDN